MYPRLGEGRQRVWPSATQLKAKLCGSRQETENSRTTVIARRELSLQPSERQGEERLCFVGGGGGGGRGVERGVFGGCLGLLVCLFLLLVVEIVVFCCCFCFVVVVCVLGGFWGGGGGGFDFKAGSASVGRLRLRLTTYWPSGLGSAASRFLPVITALSVTLVKRNVFIRGVPISTRCI